MPAAPAPESRLTGLAGTLQIGNGGTTGSLASGSGIQVPYATANVVVNRSNDLTLGSTISGLGTLQKLGLRYVDSAADLDKN